MLGAGTRVNIGRMKFDKTALGETAHRADVQISAWPVVQRGASPYKSAQPQDVYSGAWRRVRGGGRGGRCSSEMSVCREKEHLSSRARGFSARSRSNHYSRQDIAPAYTHARMCVCVCVKKDEGDEISTGNLPLPQ